MDGASNSNQHQSPTNFSQKSLDEGGNASENISALESDKVLLEGLLTSLLTFRSSATTTFQPLALNSPMILIVGKNVYFADTPAFEQMAITLAALPIPVLQ